MKKIISSVVGACGVMILLLLAMGDKPSQAAGPIFPPWSPAWISNMAYQVVITYGINPTNGVTGTQATNITSALIAGSNLQSQILVIGTNRIATVSQGGTEFPGTGWTNLNFILFPGSVSALSSDTAGSIKVDMSEGFTNWLKNQITNYWWFNTTNDTPNTTYYLVGKQYLGKQVYHPNLEYMINGANRGSFTKEMLSTYNNTNNPQSNEFVTAAWVKYHVGTNVSVSGAYLSSQDGYATNTSIFDVLG